MYSQRRNNGGENVRAVGLWRLGIKENSLKEVALAGASGQAASRRCQGGPGEDEHGEGREEGRRREFWGESAC